jgi:Family of unknown function (DUF6267)
MRINEIRQSSKPILTEAKARIDHPEDLIFTEGPKGALRALAAFIEMVKTPTTVSIKWDGSPALIFGRDEKGFVLTDKSGFSAKGYDGMPRNAKALNDMLNNRRPGDVSRAEYSAKIASLWSLFEQLVPRDFKGYLQGDLLWVGQPEVKNGAYHFKPNKVEYSVPVKSTLGENMAGSKCGVVIHSMFASQQDFEPKAVNVNGMGLHRVPGLTVVSPSMPIQIKFTPPKAEFEALKNHVKSNANDINAFLNPSALAELKLTTLPQLFPQYLSYRAGRGDSDLSNAPRDFLVWLASPASKLSQDRATKVINYVQQNSKGYNAAWQIALALINLKDMLRTQLDNQAKGQIGASLNGEYGHEGFVAATSKGTIKLVNRPVFMRKE